MSPILRILLPAITLQTHTHTHTHTQTQTQTHTQCVVDKEHAHTPVNISY